MRLFRAWKRSNSIRPSTPAIPLAMETLEGRTLLSGSVTSLTLVNADTERDLMTLNNGAVLNLAALPTRNLNIRANISGTVECVRFALDANSNYRTENYAPYSLAGDSGTAYDAWTPSAGSHILTATAYSADNASGIVGTPLTITFSVTDQRTIPGPPQTAVNKAIAQPLIRYSRTLPGGAHVSQAGGGAPEVLAMAAYAGNTSADQRLLEQMRYTITGGNDISANGGYPSQHERHVTGMYAIARNTPRIWNQLTATEKTKIDLLMKAALVASAFTTSDSNPYVMARTQQYALDGDSNLSRDWNPNYREGMIGAMLVGLAYFGGPENATRILDSYDHASFVAQLKTHGLTNIHQTFTWQATHPTSKAPTGATIQSAVRNYRYNGLPLTSYMAIYWKLASNTFSKTVTTGLYNGAGYKGYGKMLSSASTLPNKGALGMIAEFDSVDAGGPRSSAVYAYNAYRVHQINHLVLLTTGFWQANTPEATNSLARMRIGAIDLWYKLDHTYSDYANGAFRGAQNSSATDKGYEFARPLWGSVVRIYHKI